MRAGQVRYCPRCGTPVETAYRAGRERPVCPNCDWVFFPDPKVAVATLIEQDGKVLLVQRAHNPFRGKWMLPAGFVDAGEDPQEAAVREVEEETSLQVDITQLRDVFANRAYEGGADIIIVYQGEVISGELKAGDDAAQAIFFSRDHLPALAFESTKRILFM